MLYLLHYSIAIFEILDLLSGILDIQASVGHAFRGLMKQYS